MTEPQSYIRKYDVDEFVCNGDESGELGAGGFGTVRLGSHRVLGNVALKCFSIFGGDVEKERVAQQIKTELELLQQANHNHVVRVHGWIQWPESMALVLEHMPGGNLKTLLQHPQINLSPVLRLRICLEIAEALAFIHNLMEKKRLTHGDVKPENVLLTKDLHCKLGDFGSAKVAKRTGFASTTGSDPVSSALTRVYAAPERLEHPTKPKTEHDTYSFGLIVHMVLAGEVPYEYYTDAGQYLEAVRTGGRPLKDTIIELKKNLSSNRDRKIIEALESVMERCWDQTPSRRPKMLDIREELYELISEVSPNEIVQSAAAAISKMGISIPTKASNHVPLKLFNTRDRAFRLEASEGKNVYKDGAPKATMASANQNRKKTANQQRETDDVVTIKKSRISSIERKVHQLTSAHRDGIEIATMARTSRNAPQEIDQRWESDAMATIFESASSSTKNEVSSQNPAQQRATLQEIFHVDPSVISTVCPCFEVIMNNIFPIAKVASLVALVLNIASFFTSHWMEDMDGTKSAGFFQHCFNGICKIYSIDKMPLVHIFSIIFAIMAAVTSGLLLVKLLREERITDTRGRATSEFFTKICIIFTMTGLLNCSTMIAFPLAIWYPFYGYSFYLALISSLISYNTALLVALKSVFFNNY